MTDITELEDELNSFKSELEAELETLWHKIEECQEEVSMIAVKMKNNLQDIIKTMILNNQ